MSFKDFTTFNEATNQLGLLVNPSLGSVIAERDALMEAINEARSAAQRYASAYAKVAVWDYSNGGRPTDATPTARLSVPNNILAAASAKLTSTQKKLKSIFEKVPTGSIWSRAYEEVLSMLGAACLFRPFMEYKFWFDLNPVAEQAATDASALSEVINDDLSVHLTNDLMFKLLWNHTPIFRICATTSDQTRYFISASQTKDARFVILYEESTSEMYVGALDYQSDIGFYGVLERPAGSSWLVSKMDVNFTSDSHSLEDVVSAMINNILDHTVECTFTLTCTVSVHQGDDHVSILDPIQIPQYLDIESAYVATAVASPEQISSIVDSLSV